eukprot:1153805-Pelagomonas_calceolata.AAC.2
MFLKKAFSTTNSSRGGEGRQGKEGSSNKAKSSAQEFDGYPNLGSATTQQPSNKRSLYTVPLYKEDYFDEDTPDVSACTPQFNLCRKKRFCNDVGVVICKHVIPLVLCMMLAVNTSP